MGKEQKTRISECAEEVDGVMWEMPVILLRSESLLITVEFGRLSLCRQCMLEEKEEKSLLSRNVNAAVLYVRR